MEALIEPLKPLSFEELTEEWNAGAKPLVSILCATYQHERYISDAISGFLAQKTAFPFEVIVRDDASNDGTAAVVQAYAESYPDIIRPIYESENHIQKDAQFGRC